MIPKDHEFAERVLGLLPINSLDSRLKDQVLEQGELVQYKKKKTIFKAGERDPHTVYLLDGEIELQSSEASPVSVTASDDAARRALSQLQPRRYTARTQTAALIFRIERAVLDHIISDEQVLGDTGTVQVAEIEEDEEEGDWMTRLLSSELFTRLPHENIQRFFAELEPLEAEADEVVVEQGTPGDYLYIVAEGQCEVTRRSPGTKEETTLAVLKEGDTFGEESLISSTPRNASVKMVDGGFLMRLPKPSFMELVSNPTLKSVPYSEACALVEAGAQWVDVRFPDEHAAGAIEGSQNMPLNTLRQDATKLDRAVQYVVYCDSGTRGSTGAFLLARQGLDACYLAGGLERTPLGDALGAAGESQIAAPVEADPDLGFEMVSGGEAEPPAPAPGPGPGNETAATPPIPTPGAAGADEPSNEAASTAEETKAAESPTTSTIAAAAETGADPGVSDAEVDALRAERDRALAKLKKTTEAAHELKRRFDEIRQAGKSEQTKRMALEAELSTAQADAERQLTLEKTRLQGELDKAAAKLDEMRTSAEAAVGREREKAAAELVESGQKIADARTAKEEADAARVAAEVAFQESLKGARSELATKAAELEKARQEFTQLQSELATMRTSSDAAQRDREQQDSSIEQAVVQAQAQLGDEKSRLEAECAQLRQQLQDIDSGQQERESELRALSETLQAESSAQQHRADDLDRREMDLEHERTSAQASLQEREETLTRAESALGEEKSSWQQQVEQAIAEERARLHAEFARLEEEASEASRQATEEASTLEDELQAQAAEIRAELGAELGAEHEAELAELKAVSANHLGEFRTRAEGAVAKLKADHRTRLAEQEAVLEDDRRRLEIESVRLREGLAEAQRIISELEAAHGLSGDEAAPATTAPPPPGSATATGARSRGRCRA